MDGIRECIDRFNPDVIVTDGRSCRQAADFLEVGIQGVCKLKSQAVGSAPKIGEVSASGSSNSRNTPDNGMVENDK